MSCDQRLCPGVGGCRCGVFMSPIFRDPHPTCARCRGIKYTVDVTCDICKDWSVAQWEAFLKRLPYNGRRKKCPSGSVLPPASPTPPPSVLASSEAGRPALPPRSLPPPSEGRDRSGEVEGVHCVGSREAPTPSSLQSKEGVGGGAARALASAGAGDLATSSLPGEGVAGSSCSQESLVLADPDPVAFSSSSRGDRRSHSGGKGDSTGDRSRSHSSRLSPPRGRASREERRCARFRSRGAGDWYRASSSRSTDRSRSRGRKCSHCDSSCFPSAHVRSRRSRLRFSDRYHDRQVRSCSRRDD